MKLDPSKCAFGMEEGKFLGYVATVEGIKADPKKLKVILRCTTPEGPEQEYQYWKRIFKKRSKKKAKNIQPSTKWKRQRKGQSLESSK
ncbi:hypothetical protein Tco_0949334 [Tanacetum coccineum]